MTGADAETIRRAGEIGRQLAQCIAEMERTREPEPVSLREMLHTLRARLTWRPRRTHLLSPSADRTRAVCCTHRHTAREPSPAPARRQSTGDGRADPPPYH